MILLNGHYLFLNRECTGSHGLPYETLTCFFSCCVLHPCHCRQGRKLGECLKEEAKCGSEEQALL
jgi:hypothetical protein